MMNFIFLSIVMKIGLELRLRMIVVFVLKGILTILQTLNLIVMVYVMEVPMKMIVESVLEEIQVYMKIMQI